MPPNTQDDDMGRPRAVEYDDLIDALQSVLSPLEESSAKTQEVVAALDTTAADKTVRDRLIDARGDDEVPINGKKAGSSWQWWLTSTDYYDHLTEV